MSETWPWLALAGLGAFHGLNPGMGWLFAVALGLHRRERRIVWLSLVPIALGHALSIAVVALAFLWAGLIVDGRALHIGAGLVLIGWALYHWRYGHRHRVRFGMQVGLAGLAAWSFLMATAHGAGLMALPIVLGAASHATAQATGAAHHVGHTPMMLAGIGDTQALWLMASGVHTLGYLAVTGLVAVVVYEKLGLRLLRTAWVNLDLVWSGALVLSAILTPLL
jgi:hypothetical protein